MSIQEIDTSIALDPLPPKAIHKDGMGIASKLLFKNEKQWPNRYRGNLYSFRILVAAALIIKRLT